jgi:hypothetical protein
VIGNKLPPHARVGGLLYYYDPLLKVSITKKDKQSLCNGPDLFFRMIQVFDHCSWERTIAALDQIFH